MAKQEYMGIQIDTSRDELFDKLGIQRLKESYMTDDEDTPQNRGPISRDQGDGRTFAKSSLA